VWVLDRVAHPGLGGEVDDDAEAVGGEEGFHLAAVGEVDAGGGEAIVCLEAFESRLLEGRVVVVVEVVEADNVVAIGEESFGKVVADETGGAGDEDWFCFLVCHWIVMPSLN
jgi:hypothetical protein